LTLLGPKEKYLGLVKALERSLPLLALDKFDQRNSNTGLSELSLVVSAYYLRGKGDLDVAKLGTTDLNLKKEETDLLRTLASYETVSGIEGLILNKNEREFMKYDRINPFNF